MKPTAPESFRLTPDFARRMGLPAPLGSDASFGRNGMFFVPRCGEILRCMASDGEGWEHVSVSLKQRCPTWEEMCFVKDIFWDAEEVVVQYHPAKSNYVNFHPYCLHLFRPIGAEIPIPPSILVGPPTPIT